MAKILNPPQFDKADSEDQRLYKLRQFVEDVIRAFQEQSDAIDGLTSGGSGGGYPPQLGHARI